MKFIQEKKIRRKSSWKKFVEKTRGKNSSKKEKQKETKFHRYLGS